MLDVSIPFAHGFGPFDGQLDRCGGGARLSFGGGSGVIDGQLLGDADEEAVALDDDVVGGDRVEAGKVFDVARTDVEAGAVPRATNHAGRIRP